MEFPLELRNAVEHFAAGMKPEQMKQISKNLSNRYRKESGAGKKLLTEDMEAVVYAIVRMPATFGAVYSALVYAIETSEFEASSLLDVGAGTGAVSWAAQILLNLDTITCLERENAMQNLGKALMQEGSEALRNARWISADLVSGDIVETADLVTASYVLGELSPENRVRVLDRLWQATEGMLLIVEPGTPEGYRQLQTAREYLLAKGAHLAAPCPHERPCPMKQDDWCHFTCRVSRSRLHRMLKEGMFLMRMRSFVTWHLPDLRQRKLPPVYCGIPMWERDKFPWIYAVKRELEKLSSEKRRAVYLRKQERQPVETVLRLIVVRLVMAVLNHKEQKRNCDR